MVDLNTAGDGRSDQHAVEPKAGAQSHHAKERRGGRFVTRTELIAAVEEAHAALHEVADLLTGEIGEHTFLLTANQIPGTEKTPVPAAGPAIDAATVAAKEADQAQVAMAEAVAPTFRGKLSVDAFLEPARAVLAIVGAEGITEDDALEAVAARVGLDALTAGQRTLIRKAFHKVVLDGDARIDEGCYFTSHPVRKIPGEDEPDGQGTDAAPESEEPTAAAPPPKRGGGRPKGSKTKPKAGR